MKKLIAILLAVILCIGITACAANVPAETTAATTAATETQVSETPKEDIVILYTNDVHTYIDGVLSYDVIAALKTELEAIYGNVLLVDAGDAIQGTAYGSMDKGETIVKLMNVAGYDLATLGNHEFDYGMEGCMNAIEWAEYPYVSCNFYHEENGVKGESHAMGAAAPVQKFSPAHARFPENAQSEAGEGEHLSVEREAVAAAAQHLPLRLVAVLLRHQQHHAPLAVLGEGADAVHY